MSYKNGVYVAFNGCNTTNPIESDIKYYNLMKAWKHNKNFEFYFNDSHEKTYSVKDSSSTETLKQRLCERMRNSKLMLVIITENSWEERGLLGWEIEQAIEFYNIPIVVVYTTNNYKNYLPKKLKCFINERLMEVKYVPFNKEAILDVINEF